MKVVGGGGGGGAPSTVSTVKKTDGQNVRASLILLTQRLAGLLVRASLIGLLNS